ncbi:MAG TPA: hypothetical protein VHB25_07430 [Gemmatimonadaceae bacterium]|nr:hypothetical protein [Gemmatimonadaceae bacterium]
MRTPVIALLLCALGVHASAQSMAGRRAGVVVPSRQKAVADSTAAHPKGLFPFAIPPRVLPYSPIASAIVPGAGQAMLGDNRAIAYLAVEALGWVQYLEDRRDQSARERAFKDIAARVARAHFSSNPPDAPWAYYEQMRDYLESGVFSKSTTGVVPETDVTTYNGFEWDIIRHAQPDSVAALAMYEQIAVRPEYQWSWKNAGLQWDIFKRTTGLRNDAFRRGQHMLSIILANHVISMIDAFTTFRLRAAPTRDGGAAVGVNLKW